MGKHPMYKQCSPGTIWEMGYPQFYVDGLLWAWERGYHKLSWANTCGWLFQPIQNFGSYMRSILPALNEQTNIHTFTHKQAQNKKHLCYISYYYLLLYIYIIMWFQPIPRLSLTYASSPCFFQPWAFLAADWISSRSWHGKNFTSLWKDKETWKI